MATYCGVHWVPGQTKGQSLIYGRRGLEKPNYGVWGPLRWSQNTTKVVVVSDWSAAQGKGLPCSSLPRLVKAWRKITKLNQLWILEDKLVENNL